MSKAEQQANGANLRDVWTFPTQGYGGPHFATFPEELPRRPILAGTSKHGVCSECGAPWTRDDVLLEPGVIGWSPTCDHESELVPATVLDPFSGTGTTVAVAQKLGRRGIGVDLSTDYLDLAVKRVGAVSLPMVGL